MAESGGLKMNKIYLISGACGCGKSSLSKELASMIDKIFLIGGDELNEFFHEKEDVAWEDRLKITWENIIAIAQTALRNNLNIIIDYVVEEELPRLMEGLAEYEFELRYIVLVASEQHIRARIMARGDVDLIDRALFLRNKLMNVEVNIPYLYDNSDKEIKDEVYDFLNNSRFIYDNGLLNKATEIYIPLEEEVQMYQEYIDYVKAYLDTNNGERSQKKELSFRSRTAHSERVYKLARKLSAGISGINENVLFTAATFHDIGHSIDKDNSEHSVRSADIFKEYAITYDMDKTFAEEVYTLIKHHSNKELLKQATTPIELILLMEADLLEEEGAMGIVYDCMAVGALNPTRFEDAYYHIKKYSAKILEYNPMVTDLAKKYWTQKQKTIIDFLEQLEFELNIVD
jgi:uncharacterized protein